MAETNADEAAAEGEEFAADDQSVLDMICNEISQRPHLALPILEWMIPEVTFAPSKSLTGPGSKRFVGKIGPVNPEKGYCFLSCPEASEIFGIDVFLHSAQRGAFEVNQDVDFAVLLNKDGKPQAFDLTPVGAPVASGKGWQKGEAYGASGKQGWQKGDAPGQKGGQTSGYKGWQKGDAAFSLKGGYTSDYTKGKSSSWKGDSGKGSGAVSEGERYTGTLTSFLPAKNYGFVHSEDIFAVYGKDLWLHGDQKGNFEIGDPVSFTLVLNKDGNPQAVDLHPANSRAAARQPVVSSVRHAPSNTDGAERFVGTITSFYPQKGFGFIQCPETYAEYSKDLWVHHAQVGNFVIGDQVSFSVILNKDGNPQAIDLQAVGARGVRKPVESAKRPFSENVVDSRRHTGSLSSFYPHKGFGFIQCSETYAEYGKDLWVHSAQVGNFAVGDSVSFSVILNKDGNPQAIDLESADGEAPKAKRISLRAY
eukprot:TRINITY_DN31323_c0_g1_i1.p1 TRINITY_DN31323_c0_g1~~TRINITY_DN31323_c0_g1_i1.p1  ORF type:complete len:479 (-),score=61.92 TRINITY_DN31323_c0_g1_i1:49-1485(-)